MKNIFTKHHLFLFLFFVACKVNAQSVGGTISGATSICPNSTNSGFLMLNGYSGSILYWEATTDGGITWNNIGNPISSYSYSNLTQTTCYRVIVKDGTFPADTSTAACITIIPPSVGGTLSGGGIFCSTAPSGVLSLTGNVGSVVNWQYSTDGGMSWIVVSDTNVTLVHPAITQNTIYQTIVQNGAGCPTDTSSQEFFTIDPVTVAGVLSGSDTVCYGTNSGVLNLSGTTGTISGWMVSTDNGINWTTVSNITASQNYGGLTQTTLFAAIVKSGVCNADTAFAAIIVRPPPGVNAGNDTAVINGQSLMLNGSGTGTALWSPSAGLNSDTSFTPIATPGVTTNYILTVTDLYGCMNKDSVLVTVTEAAFEGLITNLFTPNNDGVNDTWYIKNIENFPDNEVAVFNIYGNKVYETKGYTNDWKGLSNGSELPDGTYYYVLKMNDSLQQFKGSVDILRSK